MPIWPRAFRAGRRLNADRLRRAFFSTYSHERVDVRCGSAGHVSIDLHNISQHSPGSTFFVHLPPRPSTGNDDPPAALPDFLQDWPVASINYRWAPEDYRLAEADSFLPSLGWPNPVHDTAFAFSWLADNLAPEGNGRRAMYVYGSHLGASLATSLALTESHTHARFGVRGLIAYNGIYNWTMFLPDHRINRPKTKALSAIPPPALVEGSHLDRLQGLMPQLFGKPANLFDPFASPSLFFHSPGLAVPSSFTMSMINSTMIDALAARKTFEATPTPRKSHSVFPPRKSTLKIPETLLLHDSPVPVPVKTSTTTTKASKTRRRAAAAPRGNTFEAQAEELIQLMRRSIEKVELKERSKWDDDVSPEAAEEEGLRRVQAVDVGDEVGSLELGEAGQETALAWLRDRI